MSLNGWFWLLWLRIVFCVVCLEENDAFCKLMSIDMMKLVKYIIPNIFNKSFCAKLKQNLQLPLMAREQSCMMEPWIEALPPSLIDLPLRPSNTPKLETIREEQAEEEYDDDEDEDDELMKSD
ncbi:hypothetical protein J1N35_031759 [Gossypium stocksii]|uniref:Uncharacterized protein n=1 Tax=Gossypium stocksii TaxID=47602 RepID=A0A9D3ZVE2_9ROSI|nr:hypothetical protein J1N35_031759 [Gossypium stocksii]